MTRRFWVFIEQKDGVMHPVAAELLGVARRLTEEIAEDLEASGEKAVVEGILVGHNLENAAREVVAYGAERVYTSQNQPWDGSILTSGVVGLAEELTAGGPQIGRNANQPLQEGG